MRRDASAIGSNAGSVASRGCATVGTSMATPLLVRRRFGSTPISLCWRLTCDAAGHCTIAERRRHELAVYPRPARDDDIDVRRVVRDADVRRVVHLLEPARAPMLESLHGALGKARQRNARALEEIL